MTAEAVRAERRNGATGGDVGAAAAAGPRVGAGLPRPQKKRLEELRRRLARELDRGLAAGCSEEEVITAAMAVAALRAIFGALMDRPHFGSLASQTYEQVETSLQRLQSKN